jgi:alpha-L-fucosidase 2
MATSAAYRASSQCLSESDAGEIRLLPALPSAWPSGRVTGIRAPGGFEIDMSWRDRAVERATVRSRLGRPLRLRRGEVLRMIDRTSPNTVLVFDGEGLRPVFGSDR